MPPADRPAATPDARRETKILFWLIVCATVSTLVAGFGLNSLSTDDAMRLVQVRDLLAGQSWFDLTQYRLDPPQGVVSHWSRLVDLPLAVLIQLGKLAFSQGTAEQIALVVWPTALLIAFFAGTVRVARELSGELAARAALIFAVLMGPVLQHFRTGSIHHHNIQLVLVVWSLACVVRMPARARDGALAGLLGALSVAIGQEMVPAIAALAVVMAVRWIVEGPRCARVTMAYGLTLAFGAIMLGAVTIAPSQYLAVHCDALSVAQIGALALGGFGLCCLIRLAPRGTIGRMTGAALLAAILALSVRIGAPQCLADPYASLDPRLAHLWLSSVSEARGLAETIRDLPQQVPAYFGVPLAALAIGTVLCWRDRSERRWSWIACTSVQAVFLLVSVWQLRGTGGANALAAILFPAALLALMPRPDTRATFGLPRAALWLMLFVNPIALLALGIGAAHAIGAAAVTGQRIVTSGDAGTCQRPSDYAPLAALPPGRMLAFIDSGPFILLESAHTVFGGPYHRNQAGNLAVLDMFLSPAAQAEERLAAHGIAYVAFCPGAPERYQYAADAPGSLAAALAANDAPRFLQRIPLTGSDLVLYRVSKR